MSPRSRLPGLQPDSTSIRAFIAVEIPSDVKDEVCRLIAHFRQQGHPVRWVGPNGLHLTLVFLGHNPPEFIEQVKGQLAKVASETRQFDLALKGIGVFPNERSPRVIWLGAEQGTQELCNLAEAVRRALVAIGFAPEKRAFSPHLTLGRVKAPIKDVRTVLGKEYASRRFPVRQLALFQSHLKPTGPVYERLAEYKLGQ